MGTFTFDLLDGGKPYLFSGNFSGSTGGTTTVTVSGATNIGTGSTVYNSIVNKTLEFNTFKGSGSTTITNKGNNVIVYTNVPAATVTGATNIGTGSTVYNTISNKNLQFKSFKGSGSTTILNSGNYVIVYNKSRTYQTLNIVSSASTMNTNTSLNALITLTSNVTITISNLISGDEGNIIVTQGASNYTVTLSPKPYVVNAGAGIVSIKNGNGSITIISYTYDGSKLYVNTGDGYTNA
jgi:hypothetical protein